MKRLTFILVAAAAALFSATLCADDYPSRPITIVAVFGPGSASDTICRIIADKLSPALGQPVIVEDRPGADGALAALYVHHQPADGYTLLMGTNSPLSADPFIHRGLGYDPDQGLCADHPRGKFHPDARGRSKPADQFDQRTGRLCQGQSWQAVVRQW